MYWVVPPYSLAGALANRLRGGWLKNGLTEAQAEALKPADLRRYGRIMNVAAFGVITGLISFNPLLGVMAALAMYGGQSLGWGRYIGAIAGKEGEKLEEVAFIDAIIKPFRPDQVKNKRLTPVQQLQVWGFLGLSLRGLVWAAALAVPPVAMEVAGLVWQNLYGTRINLLSLGVTAVEVLPFLITGACMGLIYAVVIHTWKHNPLVKADPIGMAWASAELYYGAVLWGAFAVAFLQP